MANPNYLTTGPQNTGDGAVIAQRADRQGGTIVSELHGRYYEQNYRGNMYTGGVIALTAINNATYTLATTGATATPLVGLYNPSTSNVNCVILLATLGITITAATSTGGGPYVWVFSLGNSAVSTGSAPINCKTLLASGSQAKVFGAAALTGMTGTLAALRGSGLAGGSAGGYSQVDTAVGFSPALGGTALEDIGGSIIVPPGGVLSLTATTTPAAHSAVSGLVWEEVPV